MCLHVDDLGPLVAMGEAAGHLGIGAQPASAGRAVFYVSKETLRCTPGLEEEFLKAPDAVDGSFPSASKPIPVLQATQIPLPWHRPLPPIMPMLKSEYIWLFPASGLGSEAVVSLLREAAAGALVPAKQDQLDKAIQRHHHPGLLQHVVADRATFAALSQHNPHVAAALVVAVAAAARGQQDKAASEYFDDLITWVAGLDPLPSSLEAMAAVIRATHLPAAAVSTFILTCIAEVQQLQEASRQNRLARLLCALCLEALDQHSEAIYDVLPELESLCIQFSRNKEATELFKALAALNHSSI